MRHSLSLLLLLLVSSSAWACDLREICTYKGPMGPDFKCPKSFCQPMEDPLRNELSLHDALRAEKNPRPLDLSEGAWKSLSNSEKDAKTVSVSAKAWGLLKRMMGYQPPVGPEDSCGAHSDSAESLQRCRENQPSVVAAHQAPVKKAGTFLGSEGYGVDGTGDYGTSMDDGYGNSTSK